MGRGRAKAKQAKVARQLKYSGAGTDLDALRKELVGGSSSSGEGAVELEDEFDDLEYDDDADDEDDEDDGLGHSYGASGGR
jgi:hypothetical protein